MECLAVRITRIGLPPLHVYNVYRPPRGHASLCMTPFPMDDNVIIAGDLNAHHPDWSTGAENVGGRILRDWLLETSAITWNDPTVSTMVHRSHARYSSPDVVISTPTPGNILNWRPLASWGSDHLPIAFEVPRGYSQPRVPRLSWFSWRRADWDGMMEYLDEESSALLGKRPATNTQFAKRVASTFRRAIHQFVPRYRPGRPQKDWWTPELTVLERLKKAALSDLRSDPDAPQAQRAYSDAAAGFTHAAKLAKAAHWCSFASRINRCTDIGLLFRFVRKIDGRALRRDIPPIRHGDTFCVTADGKTELFGDHLRRVCGGPATSTTSPQWVPRCRPSSDDAGCGPITAAELDRALSNLDAKTSLDPDGLCCEFLRRLTGSATDLVLELLNISWEEGFVPDSWHNAHVVPVQKPGRDRSLPEGYRPISLTSIISKLMEAIVKNRLEFRTESPDYPQILPFCARQGGFRKGRGTEEQLFWTGDRPDDADDENEAPAPPAGPQPAPAAPRRGIRRKRGETSEESSGSGLGDSPTIDRAAPLRRRAPEDPSVPRTPPARRRRRTQLPAPQLRANTPARRTPPNAQPPAASIRRANRRKREETSEGSSNDGSGREATTTPTRRPPPRRRNRRVPSAVT
ncbi:Retrovirus-related Pol polyprotein from type-1 retrotransposable element R1 [Diplonema papillatum]|nr:Retrovirus-related Pol polyprotein from type-1 retrotransposable element R1 [Diplonema papillatum]